MQRFKPSRTYEEESDSLPETDEELEQEARRGQPVSQLMTPPITRSVMDEVIRLTQQPPNSQTSQRIVELDYLNYMRDSYNGPLRPPMDMQSAIQAIKNKVCELCLVPHTITKQNLTMWDDDEEPLQGTNEKLEAEL